MVKEMMIELLLILTLGFVLMGVGVCFIPVGGAPAALSTTAGIPTGAPMITISMGITALLVISSLASQSLAVILLSGATSSMLMISITMLFSNIVHVFGVGVPVASSSYDKDPLTGFKQEDYVSPGTTGHGIATISFVSGVIGAFIIGLGVSTVFYSVYITLISSFSHVDAVNFTAVLVLISIIVLAVISSFNVRGTIQGFYDKKFQEKIGSALLSSFMVSVLLAVVYMIILGVLM